MQKWKAKSYPPSILTSIISLFFIFFLPNTYLYFISHLAFPRKNRETSNYQTNNIAFSSYWIYIPINKKKGSFFTKSKQNTDSPNSDQLENKDSSISILTTSPSSYLSFLGGAGGTGTLGGPLPLFLSFGLAYIYHKYFPDYPKK